MVSSLMLLAALIISELYTEINDFGYPQNSEIDTLKSYITTESIVSSAIAAVILEICSLNQKPDVTVSRKSPQRLPHKLLVLRIGDVEM